MRRGNPNRILYYSPKNHTNNGLLLSFLERDKVVAADL